MTDPRLQSILVSVLTTTVILFEAGCVNSSDHETQAVAVSGALGFGGSVNGGGPQTLFRYTPHGATGPLAHGHIPPGIAVPPSLSGILADAVVELLEVDSSQLPPGPAAPCPCGNTLELRPARIPLQNDMAFPPGADLQLNAFCGATNVTFPATPRDVHVAWVVNALMTGISIAATTYTVEDNAVVSADDGLVRAKVPGSTRVGVRYDTYSLTQFGFEHVCGATGVVPVTVSPIDACVPTTCAASGANCGTVSDGCGGSLDCGTCTAPQTCGGADVPNHCGCTPTTCAAASASCGTIADGCGRSLDCGSCSAPETCGGAGISNQCGCPAGTIACGGDCVSDACTGGRTFNRSICACECPNGTSWDADAQECQGDYVISGGSDASTPFHVDDVLDVYKNGVRTLTWNGNTGSVSLKLRARPGDCLEMVAYDIAQTCRHLSPLYLHHTASAAMQFLTAGFDWSCSNPGFSPPLEFFRDVAVISIP